jgi:glucan phosphoethanolaminetransferase (alkaline phosphatase superfamily)
LIFSLLLYSGSFYVVLFVLLLSFSRFRFYIASTLTIFTIINDIFDNFFARDVRSYDIWLFFTHIDETFETLVSIPSIATIALLKVIILIATLKYTKNIYYVNIKYITLVVVLLGWYFSSVASGLGFVKEMMKFVVDIPKRVGISNISSTKEIYPIDISDKNIVLIFGESLRADIFTKGSLNKKYLKDKNYISNSAISVATNTDVVLPLFINVTYDIESLNSDKNLFKLAKRANFTTYFFSTQSKKSLNYIEPYLEKYSIDYYQLGNKYEMDDFLLQRVKEVDFSKKSFVILQMYGTHAPYKRYPKEYSFYKAIDDSMSAKVFADYNNGFLYTEYILEQLLLYIKNSTKRDTIVLFVSDHGQLIGQNNQYGHNIFDKHIYTVPYFIYTINHKNSYISKELYQLDIANIILEYMGYEKDSYHRPYRVNGTMITGEDGYISY